MRNNNTNNNSTASAQELVNIAQLAQLAQLAPVFAQLAQLAPVAPVAPVKASKANKAQPVKASAPVAPVAPVKASAIEWTHIERQNERQTVYDVRQALVNGQDFSGLVKAWIVLNEKKVPADDRVRKVCDDIRCACLVARQMSVKPADNKKAHFEVASMVTVKRAFYCAMRGMPIVETRNDTRPETRGKKASK